MSDLVAHWYLRFQADPFVRSTARALIPVGNSLADAVAGLQGLEPEMVELFVGEVHVPRERWHGIRPRAGLEVEARAVPGAPAAIGIGAALAGSWATNALVAIGISSTWAAVAGVAVTFAIQAIASALFTPKTQSFEAEKDSRPTYSISGARNDMRPWQSVPVVMGTHRMTPPHGAIPYTEVAGSSQYLRMVLVWGYGPVEVSDLRIGNTPLSSFKDIEIEHDLDGTLGDPSLYPNQIEQTDINIKLAENTFVERTTAADCDEVLITLVFPNGLYAVDEEDGDREYAHAIVRGDYRAVGDTSWTQFHNERYEAKKNTPIYKAGRVVFPVRGQYEVRFTRDEDQSDTKTTEMVHWLNMKSVTYGDVVSVPGIAKTAVRIKATGQLNSVIDQFNALVSRKIPVWNGSAWAGAVATSNPAAIFRDVLRGAANAKSTTATADDVLGDWFEFCETEGLTYKAILEQQVPLAELLDEIAAAGFASKQLIDGAWGVIIDRPQATVVQHFTPRNTWGFSGAISYPEQPHALRVQFTNEDRNFEADERIVCDDGWTEETATKYEVIRPAGATTADLAYRMGRHFLASGRLRPEQFSFSVDFENLVAVRGDLVRLTHDVALVGQAAARIKDVTGTTVTLDDYVTFEAGKTYGLRVRAADGTSLLAVATGTGSTKAITVSDATGMAVGDLAMFGESGQESILCLVQSIEPGDELSAQVTCIPYNADVYSAADVIPDYQSVISLPVSLSVIGPATPVITAAISDEATLPRDYQGTPRPSILLQIEVGTPEILNARITATTQFLVTWGRSDEEDRESMVVPVAPAVRIDGVETGEAYDISVQALDAEGRSSAAATVSSHVVAGFTAPPPAVDTLRAAHRDGSTYLEWTYPSIVGDVTGFEIRWHPDPAVTDWTRMTAVATDVPRAARSLMVPTFTGAYAIKPFDFLGNRSESATYAGANALDPGDYTEVATFYTDGAFPGTLDGVAVISSDTLQLVSDEPMSDWTTLDSVTTLAGTPVTEGTYTFWGTQDLGAVYTVTLTWAIDMVPLEYRNLMSSWASLADLATLLGDATGDEYSVEMQVSYSRDDVAVEGDATFTDWTAFTAGQFTGRRFRFRAVLQTSDPTVTPSIDWLQAQILAADRVERGEDVSSPAALTSVGFAANFMAAPNVSVTPQDMAPGDRFALSNKAVSGFDIEFFDSGGSRITRVFDWTATGYGKEAA